MQIFVATKLTDRMDIPFYSDRRFADAPIVYRASGCPNKLHWEYSDRLLQFDYAKHENSIEKARAISDNASNDPRWHKAYLEAYYPGATLWAIRAGYNLSSGYPYWCYGFTMAGDK